MRAEALTRLPGQAPEERTALVETEGQCLFSHQASCPERSLSVDTQGTQGSAASCLSAEVVRVWEAPGSPRGPRGVTLHSAQLTCRVRC